MALEQSAAEQKAMQLAESSRESHWRKPSFLRDLFLGRFRPELVDQAQEPPERAEFRDFMKRLEDFLREEVDSALIDATGEYPPTVIRGLTRLGAFGMKIPKEYGGLGLSQWEYGRVMALLGSVDGNITALLSAHQSIGVPQPVKIFGTEDQKQRFLPRCAAGAISGFALTEPDVGSDPASLSTTAEPSADGTHFVLTGEKLWCTNGTIAELLVVMARNPDTDKISTFVVETSWPGVNVAHRCHFMGLKALANGVITFERLLRDSRINRIFEGSSEIMHLFMAREAVDKHLEVAGSLIDPDASLADKLRALPRMVGFYATWYPKLWLGWGRWPRYQRFGALATHLRFVERSSRKLARQIFHGMSRYQAGMQRKQAFLFRTVDIATELYVMTVTSVRAARVSAENSAGADEAARLADLFCRGARRRVRDLFRDLWSNDDALAYRIGQRTLEGRFQFLEEWGLGLGLSADDLRPVHVTGRHRQPATAA